MSAVPLSLPLGPLAGRDFRNLYIGQAVSVMGDGLLPVAVAFAAIEVGGGAGEIGIVLGAHALSLVVFALAGGVWADRLPRRLVMLAADVLRLAVQGAGAALLLSGRAEVWHLAALLAVYGGAEAFFRPAATALVPHTVKPYQLQQANALLGLTESAGTVLGPAIGGVLVALVGAGGAYAFDAASFLVSALFLVRLQDVGVPVSRADRRPFLSELAEGFREVRRQSWLWWTIVVASLWVFLALAPLFVLGPLVAENELSGASSWAAILAAYGVGGVVGGLAALRSRPQRPLLVASLLFAAEAPLPALLAVAPPTAVIAAAAFLGGVSSGVFEAVWNTTLQERVPDARLARVSALDWMGSLALLPVGYALAGPVSEAVGSDAVLWVAASAAVVGAAALALHRGVRAVRRLPAGEAA